MEIYAVPPHLVLTDSRKCPLVSSMLNHIATENCYWVISTSSLDWLISVQLVFPHKPCLIKHHNFQSIPYKFAILFFNSEDNQTRGWSVHDCTVMRRSFQRSFYAFFFICIGIMPAFKNIMWLTVYPPSPSASFLRHSDVTVGLAIGQNIERGFEKRIECLPLPWVSGGALQLSSKKEGVTLRILYDKNGCDQKADLRYFMHNSMLTHKVKGMQWVKEERNCVENCLGSECITYMVPFNLHHGYIHWPSFYPWNTQSPEGLFSPSSCRARMRTWDWLDGKGHALCLSYYCYSKMSRSTAVRSGGLWLYHCWYKMCHFFTDSKRVGRVFLILLYIKKW